MRSCICQQKHFSVLQIEFDEKELRKEISYAIKNIHGVRQVKSRANSSSHVAAFPSASFFMSIQLNEELQGVHLCSVFCVSVMMPALLSILVFFYLIPSVCSLPGCLSASLSFSTSIFFLICPSSVCPLMCSFTVCLTLFLCVYLPCPQPSWSMSPCLSVCPSGQACSPQIWHLRP